MIRISSKLSGEMRGFKASLVETRDPGVVFWWAVEEVLALVVTSRGS
jgi:hypothetical protein